MKQVTSSKEDYLEAILINLNELGACRVTDLAHQMGFSKSSASVALNKLEAEGFIKRDDWRILLTEKGRLLAQRIYDRHLFFLQWFIDLGVEKTIAEEDACKIEHILSDESYEKIKAHVEKLKAQKVKITNKD